jgi:hypothetical protein
MARHWMFFIGLVAGISLMALNLYTGFLVAPANAIPAPQAACSGSVARTTVANGFQAIPGLTVTVDNGNTARRAIVQVSADMGVDPDAEVRLAYVIDGGSPQEGVYGPANFANHQQFWETRATIAVIPLAAGRHTISAYWRVSGATGKNAVTTMRCMTVEARTS